MWKRNEASKIVLKFAASDALKILQTEVISECGGLLNVSMWMRLLFYAFNVCLTYSVTSTMNYHLKNRGGEFA